MISVKFSALIFPQKICLKFKFKCKSKLLIRHHIKGLKYVSTHVQVNQRHHAYAYYLEHIRGLLKHIRFFEGTSYVTVVFKGLYA